MKIIGKGMIQLSLVILMLTSCSGFLSARTTSTASATETTAPTVSSARTETPTAFPTPTLTLTPPPASPSPVPPSENNMPISEHIVHYYFVKAAENAIPAGSVVIMPNELIVAPAFSDMAYGPDIVGDLRTALETVLNDERNVWVSSKLEITNLAFSEGHADVVLDGEYFAVAPVILTAARTQILMTLFANPSIQTATVTLNGDTIANIDASREGKPADYVYTRTEIETFAAGHAYVTP